MNMKPVAKIRHPLRQPFPLDQMRHQNRARITNHQRTRGPALTLAQLCKRINGLPAVKRQRRNGNRCPALPAAEHGGKESRQ